MLKLLNVQKALRDAVEDVIFKARINLGRRQVYVQNDGKTRSKKIDTTSTYGAASSTNLLRGTASRRHSRRRS